jgi:hypothetical protein
VRGVDYLKAQKMSKEELGRVMVNAWGERDGVIMLGEQEASVCGKRVELKEVVQGLLKGEVSLHHWH